MEWEKKAWGRVKHIFHSSHAAVSILEVKEGFRCSRHRHNHRWNQFCPIDAELAVEIFLSDVQVTMDEGMVRRLVKDLQNLRVPMFRDKMNRQCSAIVHLMPGDVFNVPNEIVHRFRVLKSGNVVEVYWTDSDHEVALDDIVRFDEGGLDDLEALRKELGINS